MKSNQFETRISDILCVPLDQNLREMGIVPLKQNWENKYDISWKLSDNKKIEISSKGLLTIPIEILYKDVVIKKYIYTLRKGSLNTTLGNIKDKIDIYLLKMIGSNPLQTMPPGEFHALEDIHEYLDWCCTMVAKGTSAIARKYLNNMLQKADTLPVSKQDILNFKELINKKDNTFKYVYEDAEGIVLYTDSFYNERGCLFFTKQKDGLYNCKNNPILEKRFNIFSELTNN